MRCRATGLWLLGFAVYLLLLTFLDFVGLLGGLEN
jgi:hypothetical protein